MTPKIRAKENIPSRLARILGAQGSYVVTRKFPVIVTGDERDDTAELLELTISD